MMHGDFLVKYSSDIAENVLFFCQETFQFQLCFFLCYRCCSLKKKSARDHRSSKTADIHYVMTENGFKRTLQSMLPLQSKTLRSN